METIRRLPPLPSPHQPTGCGDGRCAVRATVRARVRATIRTTDRRGVAALDALFPPVRELAARGASRIYLAHDPGLDRLVVVKALFLGEAAPGARARFRREVQLTARLQHPHVVPVLAAGRLPGAEWYTMPYLAGDSLAARLRDGPLRVADALRVARALAGALQYVHEQGVVHRDVKPANVLLSDGHPVLVDFGIACPVAAAADEHITLAGTLVGTPIYMSPEQCTGDAGVDGRTDVYALGCVLHEMLTGRPPFEGRDDVVLWRRLREAPPPPSAVRPSVPEAVDRLVARALAPQPADRFATAAELAAAIDALVAPASPWRLLVRGWLGDARPAARADAGRAMHVR